MEKKEHNWRVSSSKKMVKNHPIVSNLDNFQGKKIDCSSLARTINMSREYFSAF